MMVEAVLRVLRMYQVNLVRLYQLEKSKMMVKTHINTPVQLCIFVFDVLLESCALEVWNIHKNKDIILFLIYN